MKNGISPASCCRSESIEANFERVGLSQWDNDTTQPVESWSFQKIRRSKINQKESLANQARLETPLDQDNLQKIEAAMESGKKLPAIVVFVDTSTERYIIADGNHRNDRSCDYDFMNAYVVNTTNAQLKRWLTLLANDDNGLAHTIEVRVQHAASEVEIFGSTEENASRLFNVSKAKLREELSLRKFYHVFGGIPKANTLDDIMKRELASVIPKVTLTVAHELTQAVINNPGVTANMVREIADDYKKCQSADEQKAILSNLPQRISRSVKQKTNGGVVKVNVNNKGGKSKNPLDKDNLLNLARKMVKELRRPKNNVFASFTSEERIFLLSLQTEIKIFIDS